MLHVRYHFGIILTKLNMFCNHNVQDDHSVWTNSSQSNALDGFNKAIYIYTIYLFNLEVCCCVYLGNSSIKLVN